MPSDSEFTRILDWPGYRVYQHDVDEKAKTLKLWIRRKRGNRKIECSGCSRKFTEIYDVSERPVRDLPWSAFKATVFVEIYRVKCPECGVKREKVPLLPSKAPFSKRFEDAGCAMLAAGPGLLVPSRKELVRKPSPALLNTLFFLDLRPDFACFPPRPE